MKTATEYRQQFEDLVQRAEREWQADPIAYKKRLKYLAWLGYSILVAMLLLFLLIAALVVWGLFSSAFLFALLIKTKLIILVIGLLWVLGRSLFMRLPLPEGYELKREYFPQVWAEIDKLSRKLKTPTIHNLLLTTEMNAGIIQTPRLGLIGPTQNTLLIGLELILCLSTEQMRAVLAHELAHLSANHGKFSGWIYRVRMSWVRISHAFHLSHGWSTYLARRFVDWYTPYFSGYSFVLARANEFEADLLASRLVSKNATASALVTTHIYTELTQSAFWQPFYRKAYTQSRPDSNVYERLQQFFSERDLYLDEFNRYLHQALTRKLDPTDTHPTLMERLKALKSLGFKAHSHNDPAFKWLGRGTERVLQYFNQQWLETNTEQWRDLYVRAKNAQEQVNQLSSREWTLLGKEEKWQWAELTDRYLPQADALKLYTRYHRDYPQDKEAILAIGRLLLKRNDERGMHFIEKAMQDPALQLMAAEEAWHYYTRRQEHQRAREWLHRLERAAIMLNAAREEREHLSIKDHLIAPDYALAKGGDALERELLGELMAHKRVKEVWVALKKVEYFKEKPVFVLAVKTRWGWESNEALQESLLNCLTTDQSIFLITVHQQQKLAQWVIDVGKRLY